MSAKPTTGRSHWLLLTVERKQLLSLFPSARPSFLRSLVFFLLSLSLYLHFVWTSFLWRHSEHCAGPSLFQCWEMSCFFLSKITPHTVISWYIWTMSILINLKASKIYINGLFWSWEKLSVWRRWWMAGKAGLAVRGAQTVGHPSLQFPPPNPANPALPPPIVPPPLTFPLNFYGVQSSAYQAICLLIYTTVFWMDPTR